MIRLCLLLLALTAPAAAHGQTPLAAIANDPVPDQAHPARMEVLHVPSGGVEINGVAYVPTGPGPHPVLVIAHGWPGNEKNLDLAQAVRRAGWIAVTFNYRGSWGSPGKFRFAQNPEDAAAVIAWLRDSAHARLLGTDPDRIAIAGHSMGGWVAAKTIAADPALLGAALISMGDLGAIGRMPRTTVLKDARENAETLTSTPEEQADELIADADRFALAPDARALARRPLFVLTSDDGLGPMSDALTRAVRQAGGEVRTLHVATDHGWSDHRIALQTTIINWLSTLR